MTKIESPALRQVLFVGWATAAAVYLLVFLEWLFLVTRPSMFTVLAWPQRVAVLLAAALVSSIAAAGSAALLAAAWGRLAGRWKSHAAAVGLALPAMVLSATVLLLVENFTKTVFGFNVGDLTSPLRYLYAIGWLLLTLRIHKSLAVRCTAAAEPGQPAVARALWALLALVLLASAVAVWVRYEPRSATLAVGESAGELPNILLLSSDGLNASDMSVYGSRRPTTPFLDSRAGEFLISENHFTNSSMTTASIGAMLSGKLPTDTGVLRGGHVFQGEDVFQHLPGLLRQLGYYNVDISARVWGDAYDMNMRQGFHVSNGRSLRNETLPLLRWVGRGLPSEVYFLGLTWARLGDRLLHVAGVADMEDPFDLVAKKETPSFRDAQRMQMLERVISQAPRPFFAQVHLYDTHRVPDPDRAPGAPRNRFIVAKPVFSAKPDPHWNDFYDDTILAYDGFVEEVVSRLEALGELDKTVLVVNSDHGERRQAHVRLPLMIRFPNGGHRGHIVANTQRIDIAPTLLSYLGIQPPDWMVGFSLLGGEPDPLRQIVVTGEGRRPSDRWLAIVQCQRSYVFHVKSTWMTEYTVRQHTDPCLEGDLLGTAAARRELFSYLELSGLLAVPFEMQLASLQLDNNPEMRRQAVRAMAGGQVAALWLGKTMAISNAHSDFWSDGTQPAAILVRNDENEPRSRELVVGSGDGRQFPASFFVQDDEGTREYVFSGPGTLPVTLAPVAPGAERLFLIWSDVAWTGRAGSRQLGVQLHLGGSWLRELLRRGTPAAWQEAAGTILDRRVPAFQLGDGWLAAHVYGDLWTRGDDPAGIAVRNDGGQPLARRLLLRTGPGHEFPLQIEVHDGSESRVYRFERPGSQVVELPEVPPRSERLFIIRSERGREAGPEPGRELGVRLAPGPAS